ncbi:MAG: flagellar hook-length control protein FliK [Candidatus Adiutrix sp.]|nr:flagellar hook-length control protein FliK [Candidatus Adiutrix sp.]
MDIIKALTSNTSAVPKALARSDHSDREAFAKALAKARNKRDRAKSVMDKQRLASRSTQDTPYSFRKGARAGSEADSAAEMTRAGLPSSYKKQVGLALLAQGRQGSAADSMLAGAHLMDCSSPVEALKGLLNSLKGELKTLSLDKEALPALSQVLADSGMDNDSLQSFMAELTAGGLTLDNIAFRLDKLNGHLGTAGGLTATEDGLPALGQFFSSLGASSEIVEAVTSGFKPGDPLTAADLRNIIGSGDDGFLAPCLSEADAGNLSALLRSMGANQNQLDHLSAMLRQSRGQLSMSEFLSFVEDMEKAPAQPVTSAQLEQIQTILSNVARDQEMAKTPVFDEILTKMQLLGDREIDDQFLKMSPALQALRGGLSGMAQSEAQTGGGQSGLGGQHSRRGDGQEQEPYRQALQSAQPSETSPAAALETAETLQGYGGQESLARQISQKIVYSHRRGLSRLKMKLNPENMGRLDIELKVKDDQLVAHIRAESREAYQALSGEIADLKKALAEAGLEIADLTVAFDDAATGQTEFADLRPFKGRAAAQAERVAETGPTAEVAGTVSRLV